MKINGEKLRRERHKKAINQDALANAIGLSQGMVSMLEQGIRNVKWSTLESICAHIGCAPELITEDGEPSPYTQIMRDVKRLSDNQVEIVASLVREFICLSK